MVTKCTSFALLSIIQESGVSHGSEAHFKATSLALVSFAEFSEFFRLVMLRKLTNFPLEEALVFAWWNKVFMMIRMSSLWSGWHHDVPDYGFFRLRRTDGVVVSGLVQQLWTNWTERDVTDQKLMTKKCIRNFGRYLRDRYLVDTIKKEKGSGVLNWPYHFGGICEPPQKSYGQVILLIPPK